jgi:hypothetical protein
MSRFRPFLHLDLEMTIEPLLASRRGAFQRGSRRRRLAAVAAA